MTRYRVRLTQRVIEETTVFVEANNRKDAEELAINLATAGNVEWQFLEAPETPAVASLDIPPLRMGHVFYSDGSGNARPTDPSIAPGWYYQIDMAAPKGPYATKDDAARAAQETANG